MGALRFIAIFSPDSAQLFKIANQLSPRAQVFPPNGLILEFPIRYEQETLNRISMLVDHRAQIGGASTRTAAIFAAKTHPGTIITPGKDREFLDSLPIQALSLYRPVEDEMMQTLLRWGIRTFGQLISLSEGGLTSRLGYQGALLQKVARGDDAELLKPCQPPSSFEESRELEWALDSLEPLSFILATMLEDLCAHLRNRGLSAEAIRVSLRLDDGSMYERNLRLAVPMHNSKVLLSLIRLDLQEHPPQAKTWAVRVKAEPVSTSTLQYSLLQPVTLNPEAMSRTLNRLKALLGGGNVGCPVLLDTHRPDSVRLEDLNLKRMQRKGAKKRSLSPAAPPAASAAVPDGITDESAVSDSKSHSTAVTYPTAPLSLRRLRPPQPTRVQAETIVHCAGPWRSSGDWWVNSGETHDWSRDEWDIEMSDGGIYRIFWDHRSAKWFLEGIYD